MSADKDLISVQQARDLVEGAYKAQAEIVTRPGKDRPNLRSDVPGRPARIRTPGSDGG